MNACAFFGSRSWNSAEEKEALRSSILLLVEKYAVTQFYSGGRGIFDETAAMLVGELRERYPHVKNTLVLSYPTDRRWESLPKAYTDSVYLLQRRIPPRFAVIETNKAMIDKVEFIITSTKGSFGGARKACDYAEGKGKKIFDLSKKTPL
ncbi:MAG: hypothetical protein J6S04_00730 [Clostridia bacterium]|nr:hypothetical protein [Clostridia bacterium]